MNLSGPNYNTQLYFEQARWMQWERLALKLDSYLNGEVPFEAFLRTLAGGLDMRGNRSNHELKFLYEAYLKSWACLRDKTPIYCNKQVSDDICTHWIWYQDAVEDVAYGRLFFTSDNGYMGLAPPSTRPGDLICVLLGGKTPYVLRQDRKEHYCLIGECYLHGQMHRSMDVINNEIREFTIR